jgi:hypothetical protein
MVISGVSSVQSNSNEFVQNAPKRISLDEINFFVGYQQSEEQSNHELENNANGDDFDSEEGLDVLECDLLGENFGAMGGVVFSANTNNPFSKNANFEKKHSSNVENDIIRSEKKVEKRSNYQGRDDRATSEQLKSFYYLLFFFYGSYFRFWIREQD